MTATEEQQIRAFQLDLENRSDTVVQLHQTPAGRWHVRWIAGPGVTEMRTHAAKVWPPADVEDAHFERYPMTDLSSLVETILLFQHQSSDKFGAETWSAMRRSVREQIEAHEPKPRAVRSRVNELLKAPELDSSRFFPNWARDLEDPDQDRDEPVLPMNRRLPTRDERALFNLAKETILGKTTFPKDPEAVVEVPIRHAELAALQHLLARAVDPVTPHVALGRQLVKDLQHRARLIEKGKTTEQAMEEASAAQTTAKYDSEWLQLIDPGKLRP